MSDTSYLQIKNVRKNSTHLKTESFFVNLIAKIQHCQQLGVISAPPEDIHLGERLTFNILCLSYNKDICNLTPENRSCFTSCTRLTCLFRLLAESSSLKCAFSDFSRWSISSTLLHYISFEIWVVFIIISIQTPIWSISYRQMLHLDRRPLDLVTSTLSTASTSSFSTSGPFARPELFSSSEHIISSMGSTSDV